LLFIAERQLAFIHIPKNAGISIRTAMEQAANLSHEPLAKDLDVSLEEAERLSQAGVEWPGHGRIQPVHMPLYFMEQYFPHSWAALKGAQSFAMIRDPRSRFFSALLQHLNEYRGSGSIRADDPLLLDEAKRVCDWLADRTIFCEMEYIHFSRQIDYVEKDAERVVSAIFPLDRVDAAEQWIAENTGLQLSVEQGHTRREPTRLGAKVRPAARFVANNLMPHAVKRLVHPLWVKSGLFGDASKRYTEIELSDDVERFVADFYAPDVALYAEATASVA